MDFTQVVMAIHYLHCYLKDDLLAQRIANATYCAITKTFER